MTLIKTSLLSLIATFFKMLSGLVINKVISVYIGPAGLAIIGQFQNFSQIILIVAQGAINNGVVKYTAEYGKENKKLPILFSTAAKISLTTSSIVGCILILLSNSLSERLLDNIHYTFIFILFGFTIVLFVLNSFLLSILNGLKEIRNYIKINIIQSIYSLIFTSLLIYFWGLKGALVALATNQSIIFFITLFMLRKHEFIKIKNFSHPFNKKISKNLFSYSVMAITSAILAPSSQFIIRDYIGSTQGLDQAGYWQGIWYISTMYLMVITTVLATYYLPRLSEISNYIELKKELLLGYKILLPMTISIGVVIFLIRKFIILTLFSSDFLPMVELFTFQIIGDSLKITAWLLSYIMVAKAMTRTFILTEIISSIFFVLCSLLLINHYGTIGATYAYTINYIFYVIMMILVFKLYIKKKFNTKK
ncbi:O-antigen translocase [Providencia stuartii]|uniref:O-antigen translocase n=1 Tax=Providencia stuartii TaxID=588 RepID=UPI0034E4D43C